MTISADLIGHLQSSGLFTGYQPALGGIRDDLDVFKNANKFLSVQRAGGGRVDPIYGNPVYQIMIGGKQSYTQELEEKASAAINFVNANKQSGDIYNIIVQSDITGPLFLSDDRLFFRITVQLLENRVN